MTYKNLGPDVSEKPTSVVAGGGQYTADDHSFESVVFQQDRPILDWEFNLLQEILGQAGSRLLALRTIPSGFLTGDFLEAPDLSKSYTFLSAVAGNENKFVMKAADLVVNGWPVRFEYSGSATPGENVVQLPAPPGGGNRTDLVILEVWRALVSPAPSIINKSPTGQILRHGNAKAADQFPPGNVNLADDLLDPDYVQETQKRVQIQYRYRVIAGATLGVSDIDGFGTLLSRSVPYQAGSDVDGEAPLGPLAYASMSASSYGLWRAGNGNSVSAAALGTVDGFMYAVPVCAVFRRNSSPFTEANKNGSALIAAGSTNRPDGRFADQVTVDDVKDLRHSSTHDFSEVLEKNFQYVLDNTLATEHEMFADGGSTVGGTGLLVGDLVASVGSQSAGNADGVRLNFSDRSVTEAAVAKVTVAASTSAVVSLSSFTFPWAGAPSNVKASAPAGTFIAQVNKVRLVSASTDTDMLDSGNPAFVTAMSFTAAPGPELDTVTLTFNTAVTGDVFVEVLVTYPPSRGVQRNVLQSYDLWTPNPASMQAGTDATKFTAVFGIPARYRLNSSYWWMEAAHRELTLRIPITSQVASYRVTADGKLRVPERITGVPTVSGGQTVTAVTENTAYTELTITPGAAVNTALSVTYVPYRAPESSLEGYRAWYLSRAVQSLDPPAGTQTLNLVPRALSSFLHVITSGSGSPDGSFPFDAPGVQIPIPTQPAASYPESRLDSPSSISVVGFVTNTGYVRLPALLPYAPNPSQVTLFRDAVDGSVDGDNRRFWPKSDDGTPPVYSPTALAANLSAPMRHKVAFPVLCELKEDYFPYGVRGTMLMVVFSKWIEFGTENGISLTSVPSDSGAAVFRLRGGFLNPRRSDS